MTLIRRAALTITGFVVRHASPGWKEWAEGMAGEAAYIEGDWAALRWALGSLRILPDRRPAPLRTLAEARNAALNFVERMRQGSRFTYFLVCGPFQVIQFFFARNSYQRVACALAIFASIICWTLWLTDRRRLKDPANDETYDDDLQSALLYRRELERDKVAVWIPMIVCCLWLFGMSIKDGLWVSTHRVLDNVIFSLLIFGAFALRQCLRNYRRRIDELDALLAETCPKTERTS
jgi:hypothetical protein